MGSLRSLGDVVLKTFVLRKFVLRLFDDLVTSFLLSHILAIPMDLINAPMSRVTCPSVENSEKQADQVWVFSP